MNPSRRRAENEKTILIPFHQIRRGEIRPIRPCDLERLSQSLGQVIQIQFEGLSLACLFYG